MSNVPNQQLTHRNWRLGLELLRLAKPEWKILAIGTIFLAVSSVTTLIYPQAVRLIIDNALSTKEIAKVNHWAVIFFAVAIVQAVTAALRYYVFTVAGERTVMRLREQLYSKILSQETAYFDFNKTGDLMSRLSNDCSLLQNAVSVNILMALRFAVQAIGGLVLMFYTSPKLALGVLLVVPPIGLLAGWYGSRMRVASEKGQHFLGEASQIAEETISGIRTVRAFAQEKFELSRYGRALGQSWQQAMHRIRGGAIFSGLTSVVGYFAVGGVLLYGGHLVVNGEMTVGDLTQFLLYLFLVAFSVGFIGSLWTDYNSAMGAGVRVFDVMKRGTQMDNDVGAKISNPVGDVRFENVFFNYPARTDVEVLSGVSFDLVPGKSVALVGQSGSGKTTIASLLIRLYDPTYGKIFFDGRDLRALQPNWLRSQIGIVSQEPILISASIEENIRYGKPSATHDEILAAAKVANAHNFISGFPQGYKTLVGERGIQLSGGQKQRVAIARAVLKDPHVLILDEATSALDTESESLVQEALNRLMQGRTTLVIAHRLATIRSANTILVMEKGRVLESGTHEELTRNHDSHYMRLLQKQYISAGL